jgi:hypothetical protein
MDTGVIYSGVEGGGAMVPPPEGFDRNLFITVAE